MQYNKHIRRLLKREANLWLRCWFVFFVYLVPLTVFFIGAISYALLSVGMLGPDQPAWFKEHVADIAAASYVASFGLAAAIVSKLSEKLPVFPRAMKRPSIESSDSELSK